MMHSLDFETCNKAKEKQPFENALAWYVQSSGCTLLTFYSSFGDTILVICDRFKQHLYVEMDELSGSYHWQFGINEY